MGNDRFNYLLRAGDDALILGQQLGLWTGHGPAIEEDIALTNIGLDQIGQARAWLTLAGRLEGAGRDEDALAFMRDTHEFRNALLVERPNGNFGDTIARHFFYDNYAVLWLEAMCASNDEEMAAIAVKALKEARYHLQHSAGWVIRLGDGTLESKTRIRASLDGMWPYVAELFDPSELCNRAASEGWGVDPSSLLPAWDVAVDAVLRAATLDRPAPPHAIRGGRTGEHTESFGFMLAEMQFLQRAYPGCDW